MIKFLLAIALLVGTSEAALATCLVDGTSTACLTKCLGPIFDGSSDTGLSSQTQMCQVADPETPCPAASCKSCDTDDCNVIPELEDYKCNDYEVKEGATAMTAKDTQVTCKKVKGTHGFCKQPTDKAAVADVGSFSGQSVCMKCADENDEKCASESSAGRLAAVILPVIALLYALI